MLSRSSMLLFSCQDMWSVQSLQRHSILIIFFQAERLSVKLLWTKVTTFFHFVASFSTPGGILKQCFFKMFWRAWFRKEASKVKEGVPEHDWLVPRPCNCASCLIAWQRPHSYQCWSSKLLAYNTVVVYRELYLKPAGKLPLRSSSKYLVKFRV